MATAEGGLARRRVGLYRVANSERARLHAPSRALTALALVLVGLGGIVVALVIKHADNIRRGFAAGLALILTSLGEPKPYL